MHNRNILMLLTVVPLFALAQPDPAVERRVAAQRQAIAKLAFLAGEWDGMGWIQFGERKIDFLGHERVEPRLDGTLLLVEGLHHEKQPDGSKGRVVHNAMGIFSFDAEAKTYGFRTYVLRGGGKDAWAKVIADHHVEWGFSDPRGGAMRYTITLTPAGEWHEIGERSAGDGKPWTKFFEMTLKKRAATSTKPAP